jgi:hypothetical protein
MYDLDQFDDGDNPEFRYPLFTHEQLMSVPTEPIPTQSLPTVRMSPPLAPAMEVYTGQDAQLSTRELMWGLMVLGTIAPLVGVLADGFLGFLVGTLVGFALGSGATIARYLRIKAIRAGRTDLEFSQAEVKTETVLGVLVLVFSILSVASYVERRHVRLIAREIQRGGR